MVLQKVSLSDTQIAEKVNEIFDMRPYAIEQRLKLRNPIYLETAGLWPHGSTAKKRSTKIFEIPLQRKG